ncbi:hypothetical protein FJU30_22670 [Affinibrenneria salicis]|uniref:Uncharacterized protein n=1 Tax=Affinibrenneria salicis TaxID=2590031 RepID=A0A5J5FSZ8_9GAMM|nr:hypothetical protein [Affinibrenneria salicis]KAA8996168.1 hypothetical protein FJU30_22670 [Affinibrenneria salicis]
MNIETLTPIDGLTPLSRLDLHQRNIQFAILSHDKHQTLEGLQIEPIAMEYADRLSTQDIKQLDVVTIICQQRPEGRQRFPRAIFIWDRRPSASSRNYIATLQRIAPLTTFLVRYDAAAMTFFAHRPGRSDIEMPLQAWLQNKRRLRDIPFTEIADPVRNRDRQISAVWGRLPTAFPNEQDFINEVLLNRVLKNFVIQPFFTWVWDLDRIIEYRDRYWELELKHKFPAQDRQRQTLYFGINRGQLNLIGDLSRQGINTLHMILVKPIWDKQADPGYIYNQKAMHSRTLLVANVITHARASAYMQTPMGTSDESTSYSGKSRLNYHPMPVTDFQLLGTFEDPIDLIARNLRLLLDGQLNQPLSEQQLYQARIKR